MVPSATPPVNASVQTVQLVQPLRSVQTVSFGGISRDPNRHRQRL